MIFGQRQVRLERKRRRRRERKRDQKTIRTERLPEVRWARTVVISPEGTEPDLARIPSTLMSDALLELMKPYFYWPPARDELEDVMDWLQLGADIWNITVEALDAEACRRRLARLATEVEDDDPIGLVEEIARRKFARFGYDRRRVASVRVVEKEGYATVEAASFMYVLGASR